MAEVPDVVDAFHVCTTHTFRSSLCQVNSRRRIRSANPDASALAGKKIRTLEAGPENARSELDKNEMEDVTSIVRIVSSSHLDTSMSPLVVSQTLHQEVSVVEG